MVACLGLLGLVVPGYAVAAPGPTPAVRGTAEVGQNLEAVVDGRPPSLWSWLRCAPDADVAAAPPSALDAVCTSIVGAGSALYTVRETDIGFRLRAVADYRGNDDVASDATAVVRRPAAANVVPPALTSPVGPAVGTTVTWTAGRWLNAVTLDVIVQRCAVDGSACLDVDGTAVGYADGQTVAYVVRPADAGHVLVLAVQARGDEGTRVRSAPTSPVSGGTLTAPATPVPTPPPPPPSPAAPPAAPTPAGVVAGLRARLDLNVVRLTWRAPKGRTVVVVRRLGRRPVAPTDGRVVYRGKARAARDTPRSARRVWYAVFLMGGVAASDVAGTRPVYASLPKVMPRLLAPLQGARTGRTVRFAWRAADGARYYNVQVWDRRVTRRIVTRWPLGRTLTLRLPPGSYRWYVYPGFGRPSSARYGALMGQGSFAVR